MNKKQAFQCSLFLVPLFMTSCIKDSENHLLDIVYPKPYTVLFADQVRDSISFVTFDGYSLHSYADWISVVGTPYEDIKYNSMNVYRFTRQLEAKQNTTGGTRSAVVGVTSYEYTSGGRYYQLGYLNITHPSPSGYGFVFSNIPDTVHFAIKDSANVTLDSVCFNVEDMWQMSLTSEDGNAQSWVSLDRQGGQGGSNKVTLTMQPNRDMENDRKATLLLTTGEVENKIELTQFKATRKQMEEME